ncbi:GNAT family N-acetyltransferase [Roseivirga sp. BDSF3-8]|uniref:GNAT family N-acetyltransferase n=1 Tax=Roseivirga sp. BDSF3-8 TaxID=3241598 RepID=UPI003531E74B
MTETRGSIRQMYKDGRYTLLQRHQIDDNYWDSCLDQCTYRLPYPYTWWLDIVSPGWCGLVQYSSEGYSAVFPLPVRRKFGKQLLRQPVFGHQLGLFAQGKAKPDKESLVRAIDLICHTFPYIDGLALHGTGRYELSGTTLIRHNYLIDLRQSYNQILNAYAGNRRREISAAAQAGIVVQKTNGPEKMVEVFRKYIEPGIYGIDGTEYPMFHALFKKWQQMKAVTVYESVLQDQWLAGAAILRWHNRLIYIFNASTPEGKRLDALSLLIDRVVAEHAGSNVPLWFDFEAPASQSVLDYYRRFGGRKETYHVIHQNNLPQILKTIQKARKWIVQSFRK